MLLRASSLAKPDGGNIDAVADPSKSEQSSVEHAAQIIAFTDAVISRDSDAIESARASLLDAVGPEGLVDAAGVIGNFQRMNRIADAGGAVVDRPVRVLGANLRDQLGLDKLASAAHVQPAGFFSKWIARLAIPIAARFYAKQK